MNELISRFREKKESRAIKREIKEQAKILKQKIVPKGEKFSPGSRFELALDNQAILYYLQGKNVDSFSLNYKFDKTDDRAIDRTVLALHLGQEPLLNFLPVFLKDNGPDNRYDYAYPETGKGYLGYGYEVSKNETQLLVAKGVPEQNVKDPNPYPSQIRIDQAVLNILKLMNDQVTTFPTYIEAIQAAGV